MKKSLLLIIADDLYFQSSFLKKFSELIGDTEYFIKDIVIGVRLITLNLSSFIT